MLKIACCDDNEIQRELINDLLNTYVDEHCLEVESSFFSSGKELLQSIRDGKNADIYILDVVMPDINGLEVALSLRSLKDNGLIIFLSASLEYAAASYDVNAFYYLVKPIDTTKFFRVLDMAIEKLKHKMEFKMSTKDGPVSISMDKIMFADIKDRVLDVHLSNGLTVKSRLLRVPFKDAVVALLQNEVFKMCGTSMIINMSYISDVDSESVLLKDGTVIYPPKSAYSELNKAFRKLLFNR